MNNAKFEHSRRSFDIFNVCVEFITDTINVITNILSPKQILYSNQPKLQDDMCIELSVFNNFAQQDVEIIESIPIIYEIQQKSYNPLVEVVNQDISVIELVPSTLIFTTKSRAIIMQKFNNVFNQQTCAKTVVITKLECIIKMYSKKRQRMKDKIRMELLLRIELKYPLIDNG